MVAVMSTGQAASNELQADAFKRVYPEEYYKQFISSNLRPDSRSLAEARTCAVVLDTIKTADSSSLVQIGRTVAVAGIKLEHCMLDGGASGQLSFNVELASFASPHTRPGRTSEAAQRLSAQVEAVLAGRLDAEQLAMEGGGAWMVCLDVYVLDSDGALLDACLLAAVAALLSLRLPQAHEDTTPQGVRAGGSSLMRGEGATGKHLQMSSVPLALTSALCAGHVLADPTSEEEALASSLVSVITDASGSLIGVHKAGGTSTVSCAQVQGCHSAAAAHYAERMGVLSRALHAAHSDE